MESSLQPASVKKIKEIEALCEHVDEHLDELSAPLMVLHGEADVRNALEHSRILKEKAGSKKKYFRSFPDARHGILHGPSERVDKIVTEIVAFTERIVPSASRHG